MKALHDIARWPSLADQLALANSMFGERGDRILAGWLREQTDRINDATFAERFAKHFRLPGVQTADFLHRYVRTAAGDIIGGIRFYGQDTARPFVEIIAHSFGDRAVSSRLHLDRLRDCVRSEWSPFAPRDLRIRVRPGAIDHPSARIDVTIHAARYRDLARPDGRVQLVPFENAGDPIAIVRRRYELIRASDPALAQNLFAADADDLCQWHNDGHLRAILINTSSDRIYAAAGLLAIAPGRVAWIEGDEVQEEVISADHSGHGYGASAQAEWAMSVALNPERYLVGTIDRLNLASRRTAMRAGRPVVLEDIFVAL